MNEEELNAQLRLIKKEKTLKHKYSQSKIR